MPMRSAILLTAVIIVAYSSTALEPSVCADERPRFDVSDVSYLWPVPKTQADVDALISADTSDDAAKVALWDETAFNRMLDIVTSNDAAITHPSGKSRRIALLPEFRDRKTWKVVAFRADPSAPGGHPAIVEKFGSSPQLRLILQPVTVEGGKVKVHDFTAHLVYSYSTPKGVNIFGVFAPQNPDMVKFRAILDDLANLKAKLKARGIDTQGVPLGVHPGLRDNAGGADFASDIRMILLRQVNTNNFFAMSFMGLADSTPEPWVFVAAEKQPDGTFGPAKIPAIEFKSAQMFDRSTAIRLLSRRLSRRTEIQSRIFSSPSPLGITASPLQALFGDNVDINAIARINSSGTASLDPNGLKNKDIPDLIANPEMTHFFSNDCFSCHSESTRRSILNLPHSPAVAYVRRDGVSASTHPSCRRRSGMSGTSVGSDFRRGADQSYRLSAHRQRNGRLRPVHQYGVLRQCSRPGRGAWRFVAATDPLNEPVSKVVYLDQNWTAGETVNFYFTSQGSQLIPYDWFLSLEQPMAQTLLRENQNILRYRFLAQIPGPRNLDGLPVGFVAGQGVGRRWLGLTCAACHTNEIRLSGIGYRIDGAATQADVPGFLFDLVAALKQTHDDQAKFDRFAKKVLAGRDDPGEPGSYCRPSSPS